MQGTGKMPKTRRVTIRGGTRGKSVSLRYKFKIGNRKNPKSAHMLSTSELFKEYFNPDLSRDKNNIARVLALREVEIPKSLEAIKTEDENK